VSSVTFSPSVGGDGSTVTDDSNATTGLDGGGHRTRFVPALAQVVAVAANTVTKAGEASASAGAAASSASSAADQVGLTTAAGAAQVALAAAHVATASSQATASATSAGAAATSASAAAASATSAATSATSAGTAATAAATTLISAVTQRPAITPSLSVDWTKKPTAAALTAAGWTVSRAGEMTYFGPVPVKVAENLFVRSADFGHASWVKTGLVAPAAVTDESGLVGSTVIAAAGAGQHALGELTTSTNLGSQTYRVRFLCKAATYTKAIIADRTTGRAAAAFDLTAGTTIASTFGAGYTSHSVEAHTLGGGLYWCNLVMTSAAAGTDWEPTIIGYPDSGATLSATGASYTGDGTSGIEVYAAQLQHNFDGDYVPTTDVPITQYANPLLTAAANELAYQHNSRGECVGLLQYPADTNLILQSQNLGHASWSKSMVSVAVTKRLWAASAPFWRIARTDSTSYAAALQAVSFAALTAITAYTATIALMGDQWSGCTTGMVGIRNVTGGTWPTQSAVVISGPGSVSATAQGNIDIAGLSTTVPTLIRITAQVPVGTTSIGLYIYPSSFGIGPSGAAILATRVHVAAGDILLPYIPTTTAAVTRGAQTWTYSTTAIISPAEGTLLVRASVEDAVWSAARVAAALDFSGSSNFRHAISSAASTGAATGSTVNAGTTQASAVASAFSVTPATTAYAYTTNSMQLATNGTLSTLDTVGTMPPVNRLGSSTWAGLIQRTELYPRAMTSAELSAITTPGVLQ